MILFFATGLTTVAAGAMQQGVIPWETPWQLYKGLPFALTLLIILLCHEMGHYLMARYHRLRCIPAVFFAGSADTLSDRDLGGLYSHPFPNLK